MAQAENGKCHHTLLYCTARQRRSVGVAGEAVHAVLLQGLAGALGLHGSGGRFARDTPSVLPFTVACTTLEDTPIIANLARCASALCRSPNEPICKIRLPPAAGAPACARLFAAAGALCGLFQCCRCRESVQVWAWPQVQLGFRLGLGFCFGLLRGLGSRFFRFRRNRHGRCLRYGFRLGSGLFQNKTFQHIHARSREIRKRCWRSDRAWKRPLSVSIFPARR